MKKVCALFIIFLVSSSIVSAGPFDGQDEESKEIANMVKVLYGDQFIVEVYKLYPNATFEWGARAYPTGIEGEVGTWVVYLEVKEKNEENSYYYWEVRINDINESPGLASKYGIELAQ